MGMRRNLYLTDDADRTLHALAEQWGLSMSSTIARALKEASGRGGHDAPASDESTADSRSPIH